MAGAGIGGSCSCAQDGEYLSRWYYPYLLATDSTLRAHGKRDVTALAVTAVVVLGISQTRTQFARLSCSNLHIGQVALHIHHRQNVYSFHNRIAYRWSNRCTTIQPHAFAIYLCFQRNLRNSVLIDGGYTAKLLLQIKLSRSLHYPKTKIAHPRSIETACLITRRPYFHHSSARAWVT